MVKKALPAILSAVVIVAAVSAAYNWFYTYRFPGVWMVILTVTLIIGLVAGWIGGGTSYGFKVVGQLLVIAVVVFTLHTAFTERGMNPWEATWALAVYSAIGIAAFFVLPKLWRLLSRVAPRFSAVVKRVLLFIWRGIWVHYLGLGWVNRKITGKWMRRLWKLPLLLTMCLWLPIVVIKFLYRALK